MKERLTDAKALFHDRLGDHFRVARIRSIRRAVGLLLSFLVATALSAQMPRPLFGIKYDLNGKAMYTGVDSTVFRKGLYAPNTFSLEAGEPRERSRIGFVMLAPVGQYTVISDRNDGEWFNKDGFYWSEDREGTGRGYDGRAGGVGIDLEAALTYDRSMGRVTNSFDENALADLNFAELNHQGVGDPLKYQVWLNFDYIELSSCARFNVWWFFGKKAEKSKVKALDFLFEPIQFHFDYGFAIAMPVSKYGIYYKSNDLSSGIDEQVTQNMNDVLQPTTVLSRIMGVGLRAGRIDFTYRWRLGLSDALRTLGNSYGFREWTNTMIGTSEKNNAIREVGITMYLFGGGPRKKISKD